MNRVTLAWSVILSCLPFAGSPHAGTVLEITNRDLEDKSESQAKTYVQGGKMRIEAGGAQNSFAIFRDETLYTFDPKQKTYVAMDRATIKRLAEQLNPALKMMQAQLANMTPEQRVQMERMGIKLPDAKQSAEQVRMTARTGKIAGHACKYAEIVQDGAVQTEACVVPAGELQGGKELYDVAVKLSALLNDMIDSIDLPMLKQMADNQIENFDKLDGVPVLTRTFDANQPVQETTIKSIRAEALAENLFEIPSGYKLQNLPNPAP